MNNNFNLNELDVQNLKSHDEKFVTYRNPKHEKCFDPTTTSVKLRMARKWNDRSLIREESSSELRLESLKWRIKILEEKNKYELNDGSDHFESEGI